MSTPLILWILIFLSSCEYVVAQEQLAALLGLNGTTTRIPVTSIAAFAANVDTEAANKQFCNYLCQEIGVVEDIIRQKEDKILEILSSQGMVAGSQICGSDIGDKDQVLEMAYHQYCKDLYRIGFTEDLIPPKARILEILRSQPVAASSQSSGRSTGDKG